MIHQLIFASPKPGMSEEEFWNYWLNVHAVEYAAKIPQIKKYLIDTRVPVGADNGEPLFSGVAEIWLENEEEQLASLQSKEFLEGARIDEPRWAAFWRTLVLDTDTHVLLDGPPPAPDSSPMVKMLVLVKRKAGMSLDDFRSYSLGVDGPLATELPGLRRYEQCHVRDSFYAIGESTLDSVSQLWFDDTAAIEEMMRSEQYERLLENRENFTEPTYAHTFYGREHWVIGPDAR